MPRGPNGERRPSNVVGAAIMVAKIATGEIEEVEAESKDAAAQVLGRKGGKARAQRLTSERREEIARAAAAARWKNAD
jgi:hypothetical protein